MTNLTAFRLDPVRGKPQHALVTITAILGDTFVVGFVQRLDVASASSAKESLHMLQYLAMHIHVRGKKRDVTWTDEASPTAAKKFNRDQTVK